MSNSFYMTLPSHSNKNEFPDNTANHFKIRLTHPKRLEGSGWTVGLLGISLPDAKVPVIIGSEGDRVVLFKTKWIRVESSNNRILQASFDSEDLKQVFSNVDGIGFMKSMIAFFEQRRIYNESGPKFGACYNTDDGKRTYIKFKWENDELLVDNGDISTSLSIGGRPALNVNLELAKKM